MTDHRRVDDCSAGELLEAALAQLSRLGWDRGAWRIELHALDGVVRKAHAVPAGSEPIGFSVGRKTLHDVGPGPRLTT